jgi:hypothetical protein
VVDVTNPSTPSEVGTYEVSGGLRDVAVSGNYAYAVGNALRVIDVSNPIEPTEASTMTLPSWAWGVTINGEYAHIANGSAGLRVVSIADPLQPSEVASYDTPGQAWDVVSDGFYAYVGDGDAGIMVIWVSPPVTSTITTSGGSFSSSADNTSYAFPSNVFSDTVIITHTSRFPGGVPSADELIGVNHAFEVAAVYSSTASGTGGLPVQITPGYLYTITIQYSDAEKGLAVEETLGLYWWDGDAWSQQGITSSVNITDNSVTAQVDHLSLFAVLGETRKIFLPLALKSS